VSVGTRVELYGSVDPEHEDDVIVGDVGHIRSVGSQDTVEVQFAAKDNPGMDDDITIELAGHKLKRVEEDE
jgi:hypothetical protein